MKIKKIFALLTVVGILCSLVGCNTETQETTTQNSDSSNIDVIGSMIETEKQTNSESSVNYNNTEAEKITDINSDIDFSSYCEETQDYMNSLVSNKTFSLLYDKCEFAQVIDLNNDSIPELIIECYPCLSLHEEHYSYVFSKDESDVFYVQHNDDGLNDYSQYTYYGGLVTAYDTQDNSTIFIAGSLYGGPGTGEFGNKVISFDGKQLYEKNLYTTKWIDDIQYYSYFDEKFTTEKDNDEYDKYMESLNESTMFSQYKLLCDENHDSISDDEICKRIADLIEEFYIEINK